MRDLFGNETSATTAVAAIAKPGSGQQQATGKGRKQVPLATRLRPQQLDDIIGQPQITGDNLLLEKIFRQQPFPSLILWGPPGCGKTTLAQIIAQRVSLPTHSISAVLTGTTELRKIFQHAEQVGTLLLFVDEIHRYNRTQQDAFLPFIEQGQIILLGATTENPSFTLNSPLLSRCRVLLLHSLAEADLEKILTRAENELKTRLPLTSPARKHLLKLANGDARYLLNMVETIDASARGSNNSKLDAPELANLLQQRALIYDRDRDEHYNLISALHKSMRGSDPDASLYYFFRMLDGGEDVNYLARRILRFAWEDIGLADPMAAQIALTAWQTYERLGSPEGELALINAVIYLSTAEKSNAAYQAAKAARQLVKRFPHNQPPKHIVNSPTKLMRDLGYSQGYQYDHDHQDAFSGQDFFPAALLGEQIYQPTQRGAENRIKQKLQHLRELRRAKQVDNHEGKQAAKQSEAKSDVR